MIGRIAPAKSETKKGCSAADRHVAMHFLDEDTPRSLTVGESRGFWFDIDDDVYCSDGSLAHDALGARTGFPRGWPECYTSCKPLRRLVGKKGITGVRTGVVDIIDRAARDELAPFLNAHGEESSFVTASRVEMHKGWAIVKGFVVYELLVNRDEATASSSRAFVAHKHWWNINPERGSFVDLTLEAHDVHAELGGSRLRLLVESELGDKTATVLCAEQIAKHNDAEDAANAARHEAERAELMGTSASRQQQDAARGQPDAKRGAGSEVQGARAGGSCGSSSHEQEVVAILNSSCVLQFLRQGLAHLRRLAVKEHRIQHIRL